MFRFLGTIFVAFGLAACGDSIKSLETPPVVLLTDQGEVTCQLYTKENLLLDRVTNWPPLMDRDIANNYCRAEGRRRKDI